MSLWTIAWRSIQQRGLASLLTTLSMALGVMLVVTVLSVYGVVADSFRNNSSLGYNLVVGAKGGKLQLTLNTVYYLSQPVENIPYDFYLEFLPQSQRREQIRHSLDYQAHQAQQQAASLQAMAGSLAAPGLPAAAAVMALQAADGAAPRALEADRDGKYSQFTAFAIPLCLGDYFGEFRVVGTTPEMFDDRVYDVENDRKFEFAEGRNFEAWNAEHGYFEAVVGSKVAQQMNVQLGDEISSTHGDPEGAGHGQKFHVVGILAPSGTPNDRAVFINMEGFYLMEDHAKPIEELADEDEQDGGDEATDDEPVDSAAADGAAGEVAPEDMHDDGDATRTPLPVEQREVTSLLVRTANPFVAPGLENAINEGPVGQAVPPNREIFNLLELFVRPVQLALLGLTGMICLVSGISILVSIYNSMSDRRHEIAVMRALGASRNTVMTVILLESIVLSLGGGVLGWFMGHTLNWAASPIIEARTGVAMSFWKLAPSVNLLELLGKEPTIKWLSISTELLLVPALVVLAVAVGFLPALAAYRTDVAKSLGK